MHNETLEEIKILSRYRREELDVAGRTKVEMDSQANVNKIERASNNERARQRSWRSSCGG